jgi:hypothetical protein
MFCYGPSTDTINPNLCFCHRIPSARLHLHADHHLHVVPTGVMNLFDHSAAAVDPMSGLAPSAIVFNLPSLMRSSVSEPPTPTTLKSGLHHAGILPDPPLPSVPPPLTGIGRRHHRPTP